jgi:hypothetical protein
MSSPYYANKEDRERACELSEKVFGERYHWRKLINNYSWTFEGVMELMEKSWAKLEEMKNDDTCERSDV